MRVFYGVRSKALSKSLKSAMYVKIAKAFYLIWLDKKSQIRRRDT